MIRSFSVWSAGQYEDVCHLRMHLLEPLTSVNEDDAADSILGRVK